MAGEVYGLWKSMESPPKEEWWTPWQIALVDDRSRHWRLTPFQPSDALRTEFDGQSITRKREVDDATPSGAGVIPGGWDHEHCALCWREIALRPNADPWGYCDGRDWLCKECYEKFIQPRTNSL